MEVDSFQLDYKHCSVSLVESSYTTILNKWSDKEEWI